MMLRRLFWVWGFALAACGGDSGSAVQCSLPDGATVLAVGDSITRGYGADGQGYAEQLQSLVRAQPGRAGVRVMNRGVDGERSEGLLERIDAELAAAQPAVVLVTTGGNDLLRKVSETQTRANLAEIVRRVRAAGAYPVVFAVPKPTLAAAAGLGADHAMYAELAEAGGAGVIEEVVGDVLAQEELRTDAIHPNARGYARMAQAAAGVLAGCR